MFPELRVLLNTFSSVIFCSWDAMGHDTEPSLDIGVLEMNVQCYFLTLKGAEIQDTSRRVGNSQTFLTHPEGRGASLPFACRDFLYNEVILF